mmetsp:Transcript_17659/g.31775  ORF Transcript_17659/g.31775 Transcript_17659/m.31775 type:complete len:164 (+) Transcript_17659:784-1275(+)
MITKEFELRDFRVNDCISISHSGIVHPSILPNAITRFGRGAPNLNHVIINESDPDIPQDLCQIFAKRDGFYVIDAANSACASIKLKPHVPNGLKKGSLFMLGDNIFIKVEAATPEKISLEVVSGERSGTQFSFEIRSSANPIRIGSRTRRVNNDIIFTDACVS